MDARALQELEGCRVDAPKQFHNIVNHSKKIHS